MALHHVFWAGGGREIISSLLVLTNRILMVEKHSPGLNICALKVGEEVRCTYFLHPTLQDKIHTCLAVCMHNMSYVI